MQSAKPLYHFMARPDKQMIGVTENNLGSEFPQVLDGDRLDRALSPHRHEYRRLYHTVLGGQYTPAGTAFTGSLHLGEK
jgi:hypothetical protein